MQKSDVSPTGFCTSGPWEYLYQVSSKSQQALQSYGPDTISGHEENTWPWLKWPGLTFDRQGWQGRKLGSALQVHEENTCTKFHQNPKHCKVMDQTQVWQFGLDCDLDLWQTGPKVGFCTSGPWGEYLYQVSSKSHQALQSYGPDMIWHLALTVTLTFDQQGQKLGSALQVHEENTCTKFHQNPIRHCKVMDRTRFDIWPWLWPWPLTDRAESWVLHFRSMRRIPVPSFIKIPSGIAKLWTGHNLTFGLTVNLWQGRKLGSALQVHEYLYQVWSISKSGIAKLWTGHDLHIRPGQWPWPLTNRAES